MNRSDNALYKVSAPRAELTFSPMPFWRTDDWSFSDDRPHADLVEDSVLFACSYDEINLHLLPEVWRLRVWLDDDVRVQRLRALGYTTTSGATAVVFAHKSDRDTIESFRPTVYSFDPAGFERTPSNEFVAREPQTALAARDFSFAEAQAKWNFHVIFVDDTAKL
jgi:hypothetical protein